MFSSYEPIPYSRVSSPLSEYEHRVSPHDPNMSSAARYSPTPVPLPPSPFHNSVVIPQGSSSPLISSTPEPTTQSDAHYIGQLAHHHQATSQDIAEEPDSAADFDDAANDEALVSCVGSELILMQASNADLEVSSTPLMLTGIPGTDFALTRDFLVMQQEQMNVENSFGNQNNKLRSEENEGILEISNKTYDFKKGAFDKNKEGDHSKDDLLQPEEVISAQQSLKHDDDSNRKPFWCNECDSICINVNGRITHNVRAIADQPVPARAIATLPNSYLEINKLPQSSVLKDGFEYAVFAKCTIKKRTQFGPVEGILHDYDGTPINKNCLPLLYEKENGTMLKVDVSNENASNWMRFVRPAMTYEEQNLVICQQNEGIVFLTVKDVFAKEELRAGPHPDYARRRNLSLLQPTLKPNKDDGNINTWLSKKADMNFLKLNKDEKPLEIDEEVKKVKKSQSKRKKKRISSSKYFKIVDGQTLLYNCPHCLKVFPRSYSLKRHLLVHPDAKVPHYECVLCNETFLQPQIRNRHVKMCHSTSAKEKENSRHNSTEWKCSFCTLAFRKMTLLKVHQYSHSLKDSACKTTICPECDVTFDKPSELVSHITRHAIPSFKKNVMNLPPYKCLRCYKKFATRVRLQQHCLVHGAEEEKPLPCNVCLKRFMNNSALSCHLKTHRKDKQTFECPICHKKFDQMLVLKDHVELHRNEDDTFECPHCLRTFVKYCILRKHITSHHCERAHKCQFCGKSFPTVDKLRMHLLRHSDYKEFQCANCDKRFKRKDKLKEHMKRMHNVEKDKILQGQSKKFVPKVNPTDYNCFIYKCHQCLVGFKRRGMLVNHLAKRHPDVSPASVPELNLPILRQTRDYFCQYCDKIYKSSSKRKAHIMKNHPGAALPPSNRQKETDIPGLPNSSFSQTVGSVTTTPQGCQWCHKQYASKAKLLQHQRKKHPTLMEPADQIPRPRNRVSQNQKQRAVLTGNTIILTDNTQDSGVDFLKQKVIDDQQLEVVSESHELNNSFNNCHSIARMADVR